MYFIGDHLHHGVINRPFLCLWIVPEPAAHNVHHVFIQCFPNKRCLSTSTVLRILEDQRYIGTYVIGKRKVKEIGSRHTQLKDESEWSKIPNHHPATQNCHRKWINHFPTRCLKLLYPKVVISRVVPSGLRA
ncbi:MAG: hypothetical protein EP147_14140 [Subdoligranulum sp.]|nr:hypothetical protein [Subdoligranulum sp.]